MVMIVVMLVFAAAVFVMVMIVVVFVMAAAFGAYGCFFHHLLQFCFQGVLLFQYFQNLCTGQLFPGGSENVRRGIVFSQQFHAGGQLGIGNTGGVAEDNGTGVFDLVVEEFPEVLHVHLTLIHIGNRGKGTQYDFVRVNVGHSLDDIAELAYTGGFDQNPVGRIFGNHLLQGFGKVAYQTAADAAGVHFGDVYPCILQETAVDADVAEFVFDQHQLFAAVGLCDQLFDQCGFSGTQKAGEYINSCHKNTPCPMSAGGLVSANTRRLPSIRI